MATYSSNTTLKANGAIASSTTSSTTTTLYTAPSNGYAQLYLAVTAWSTSLTIQVNGNTIYTFAAVTGALAVEIFVGPSAILRMVAGGSCTVNTSGVEFVNTP